jgi:hypothetical protein
MDSFLPAADEKTQVMYDRECMLRLTINDFSNVKQTA